MQNYTSSALRMERDMSLKEVEQMSARIIDLISRQQSLAQATNYAYTHVGTNNPEQVAIQYMSPNELYQYKMSKTQGIPFALDKKKHRIESPDGAKQFPRMILALDRMFNTTGHTRENVAFIYRKYPGYVPLVKAYLKLINAERDAISNADVSLDLFQEYQTYRKILGNAQYVFQHSSLREREQSVMIRRMQTIMERQMADLAGSKLRATKRVNHTRKHPVHTTVLKTSSSDLPLSPPTSPLHIPRPMLSNNPRNSGSAVWPAEPPAPNAMVPELRENYGHTFDANEQQAFNSSYSFTEYRTLSPASPSSPQNSWGTVSAGKIAIPFDCSRKVSRFYNPDGQKLVSQFGRSNFGSDLKSFDPAAPAFQKQRIPTCTHSTKSRFFPQ